MLNDQKFLLSWVFVLLAPNIAIGPAALGPLTLLGLMHFFQFPLLRLDQNHLILLLLILSTILGVILVQGTIGDLWSVVFIRIFLCYLGLTFLMALYRKSSETNRIRIILATPLIMLLSALIYQPMILTVLPSSISGAGFWDLNSRFGGNDFVLDGFKFNSLGTTSAIGFLLCCMIVLFFKIKRLRLVKLYFIFPMYLIVIYLALSSSSKFLFLLVILSIAVFPIFMSIVVIVIASFLIVGYSIDLVFFTKIYLGNFSQFFGPRLFLLKQYEFNFNPIFGQPYSLNIQENFYLASLNFGGMFLSSLALFFSMVFSALLSKNMFQFFFFLFIILVIGQIFYILGSEKGLIGLFMLKIFFDLSENSTFEKISYLNSHKYQKV